MKVSAGKTPLGRVSDMPLGNPFAANAYRNRYFGFCASKGQ